MRMTGKRHPFHSKFEAGFDADGRLLAVRCPARLGRRLVARPFPARAGPGAVPPGQRLLHPRRAVLGEGGARRTRPRTRRSAASAARRACSSSRRSSTGSRAALGLAPELVRERNLYRGTGETNTTHYGQEIGDNRLDAMWAQVQTQADFAARRAPIAAWNAEHARVKRGLAITPVKFGISFTRRRFNQAGALVAHLPGRHGAGEPRRHRDGAGPAHQDHRRGDARARPARRKLPHHADQHGQGAEHLGHRGIVGRRPERRGGEERLRDAARAAGAGRGRSARRKAGRPVDPSEVDLRGRLRACGPAQAGRGRAALRRRLRGSLPPSASACRPPAITPLRVSTGIGTRQTGRPFYYFACGAAVSEVEVDGYTGMHRVLRVDIVHDVGDSLNPGVDRGQIEGGFVQGMGWLTREELRWDKEGRLLTHGASTYQIPAISDAPVEFRVTLLPRAAQEGTIHGSKAVGEPPLMLALSVREAIRDAVAAFGPSGGEVRLPSPATGEAIFAAVRALFWCLAPLRIAPTIVRRAAQGQGTSSPAWRPTDVSPPVNRGGKRASWGASSPRRTGSTPGGRSRKSPARRSSRPRRRCCSTSPIRSSGAAPRDRDPVSLFRRGCRSRGRRRGRRDRGGERLFSAADRATRDDRRRRPIRPRLLARQLRLHLAEPRAAAGRAGRTCSRRQDAVFRRIRR